MKNIFHNALVIVASFVFVITVVNAATTWKGPTANPPNNNTDAPINVGLDNQVKAGGLGVASLLVTGKAISASTVDGDPAGTLVTKDYLNAKLASGGSDTLAGLSCTKNQIAKFDGTKWVCDGATPTVYFTRFTYTASDGIINCDPFGSSCTYDASTGKGMYNGKIIYAFTTGDEACAKDGGRCVSAGYGADKYAFCGAGIYQIIANAYSDSLTRWQQWSGMGAHCIK